MARKKNSEKVEEVEMLQTPEAQIPVEEVDVFPESDGEAEAEEVSSEAEAKAEEVEETQHETEIPAIALGFLKRHPELERVYIDKIGGTYPEGTNKAFLKDAVLYNNPYFIN